MGFLASGALQGFAQGAEIARQRDVQKQQLDLMNKKFKLEEDQQKFQQKMFTDFLTKVGQNVGNSVNMMEQQKQQAPFEPAARLDPSLTTPNPPGGINIGGSSLTSNLSASLAPQMKQSSWIDNLSPQEKMIGHKLGFLPASVLAEPTKKQYLARGPGEEIKNIELGPGESFPAGWKPENEVPKPPKAPSSLEDEIAAVATEKKLTGQPRVDYIGSQLAKYRKEGLSPAFERLLIDQADALGYKGQDKIDYVASQGAIKAGKRQAEVTKNEPLNASDTQALATMNEQLRVYSALKNEFTADQRAQYVGYFNLPLRRLEQIKANDKTFARFYTLVSEAKSAAFGEGGKVLTPFEAGIVFGYVPTGTELSAADFEAKLAEGPNKVQSLINQRISAIQSTRGNIGGNGGSSTGIQSSIKPVVPGNIDIYNRPTLKNKDGSVSTTRSMSFEENGQEVLIPTVVGGKSLTNEQAIARYKKTGEHLGKFRNAQEADQYAEELHNAQANKMGLGKHPKDMSDQELLKALGK